MSLERDITEIKEMVRFQLDEGFAKAKQDYVDTKKMQLSALRRLATKDPTYPAKGKYVEWMAKQYMTHHSLRGFEVIKKFDELANKDKIQQKDINQYATLEDLDDAVRDAIQSEEHRQVGRQERLAQRWNVPVAQVSEEEKRKKEQARKDAEFQRTLKVDTAVISMIDTTPNWVNPKQGLKVGGYRVVTIPMPKDENKPNTHMPKDENKPNTHMVKYLEGPKNGIQERVPDDQIEGNTGDLYWQNDKVVIVAPHDKAHSDLYGRNPDLTSDIKSNWCTAVPNSPYFGNYWEKGGCVLYYILPKSAKDVPIDPDPMRRDRFSKVALRVVRGSDGKDEIAEIRDRYNKMVGDGTLRTDSESSKTTWQELKKFWGIS